MEESRAWYARTGHEEYVGAFGSWLGVPMMLGGRVLGVIATYHPTREYVYSVDDLNVLQAIANQAANAIHNTQQYNQLEATLIALEKEQSKRLAAEKWETLGQAATNLAHRMNNLAGIIPVSTQRLRSRMSDDPKAEQILDTIDQQAEFLLRLSDGLLKPFSMWKRVCLT